jgi:hypothetical protein
MLTARCSAGVSSRATVLRLEEPMAQGTCETDGDS